MTKVRTRWRTPRVVVVLFVTGAILATGVWAFTRIGWDRLKQQIAREVAYEDAQSWAGRADLVLGVLAPESQAWRDLRVRDVSAKLPAPLPAANLVPLDEHAQIVELKLAGSNVYAARVRRTYADSAGQRYQFDVWQRYRGLGPGIWHRPPM